jgi:hypothetical protein
MELSSIHFGLASMAGTSQIVTHFMDSRSHKGEGKKSDGQSQFGLV